MRPSVSGATNNGYALAGPNWAVYGHWEDEWNGDPSRVSTESPLSARRGWASGRLTSHRSGPGPLRWFLATSDGCLRRAGPRGLVR